MKWLCLCIIAMLNVCTALGQGQPADSPLKVVKLETPVYPRLAVAAHIFGRVVMNLTLATDGTSETVTVESGPPMLTPAAMASAKLTKFESTDADARTYKVIYDFTLDDPKGCDRDPSYPKTKIESNTVQVTELAFMICDPAGNISRIRFRSAKCLFLWRCGSRVIDEN